MSLPSTSSIAARLAIGFGSLLALMLVLSAMSGWSSYRVGVQVRQIVEVNNQRAALARGLLDQINTMTTQLRSIIVLTDTRALQAEAALLAKARADYVATASALEAALADAQSDEQALASEIAALAAQGIELVQRGAKQGLDGANIDATNTLTQLLPPVEGAWRAKVNQLIALQTDRNAALAQDVGRQTRQATLVGAALALGAIVIGVLVAWRIARGIQRPVENAVRIAERIAQGALDNPVDRTGGGEIGRLLNAIGAMQARLRELVGEIQGAAGSIQTASAEVAAGNADLAQRTEQAASRLQQTAGSMAQLSDKLRQDTDAAAEANRLAGFAAGVAERGGSVVAEVVATMDRISGSSQRMADIVGVIDGIAFQTNILALNAAVEAARAGQMGAGFAVVAGEVRSLAQRSAEAAREIGLLIAASQEHVAAGARRVGDAGAAMAEIVTSAKQVCAIVGDLSAASREQSGRVDTISAAVTQLDNATQQNAALVEEGTAAAESLRDQAGRLTRLVATFHLGAAVA